MRPLRFSWDQLGTIGTLAKAAAVTAALLTFTACDRDHATGTKTKGSNSEQDKLTPTASRFDAVEGIQVRAAGSSLVGRFPQSPAVVSSPCGFYLIASGKDWSIVTLLPGKSLGWSTDPKERLLRVDDVVFQPGLVQASDMGQNKSGADLLILHGQWESGWLQREAGATDLDTTEKAQGRAARSPQVPWLTWSAALPRRTRMHGIDATRVLIGSAAIGSTLFAVRALLPNEKNADKALKRVVFAIDSLEFREESLRQDQFLEQIRADAKKDPACSEILERHAQQLK